MAQTMDYFDERYPTIDKLLLKARELGAKRIGPVSSGWTNGPRGTVYEVIAEVETADGALFRRIGRARPGDAQVDDPPPPDLDRLVEDRAESRAVRKAINSAYPEKPADDGQPPHVRRVQAYVRRAAPAFHLTRDELAAIAHKRYGVESLNDVTPEQADQIEEWLEPHLTGGE